MDIITVIDFVEKYNGDIKITIPFYCSIIDVTLKGW